ncbi:MAG: hypothetical protein IJX96_04425 [Clostridia bacterium]|nr:hypothetical protein [Clostridia bacterium]
MEKEYTLEEMFCGMPHLLVRFQCLKHQIRWFAQNSWEEGVTKEDVIKENQLLLETAKDLSLFDIKIAYYLRHIDGWSNIKLLHILEDLFDAQCDCKNALFGTDEYYDPLRKARHGCGKRKKE